MSRCLVAYGNELRGDDGAAWELARRAEGWTTYCLVQLLPELVETLKDLEEVVFVDACEQGEEVQFVPLTPQDILSWPAHFGHPADLLALCRQLYGRAPHGFLLTLPGEDFGYHLGLSAHARQSVSQGLQLLSGVAQATHCLDIGQREEVAVPFD